MVELAVVVTAAVHSGSVSAALDRATGLPEPPVPLVAAPKMNPRKDDDETVAASAVAAKVIKASNTSKRAGWRLSLMILVDSERRKEPGLELEGGCILIETPETTSPNR